MRDQNKQNGMNSIACGGHEKKTSVVWKDILGYCAPYNVSSCVQISQKKHFLSLYVEYHLTRPKYGKNENS